MNGAGRFLYIAAIALTLGACAKAPLATAPAPEREAIAANLMRDITVLASDEFGGRRPGTDGETRTVNFLINEMRDAGLTSGTNDPGSAWRAPVALISTTPSDSRITIRSDDGEGIELNAEEGAAFTSRSRLLVDDARMIFVGFEADNVDPESIEGRLVVMLGEPGQSPQRRAKLFEANPAAIITVVEDGDAIANVRQAYGGERLTLASEDQNRLTAFVTHSAMSQAIGGSYWTSLVDFAGDDEFSHGPLDARASIEASSQRREFTSYNVLGLLPGEVRGSGAVLLLAHWDHLGECGEEDAGDLICNGAVDNASGIAVMLELSRRLAASGPFDRDIYVLATSAEESGLLGAKAFIEAPPVPLDTIVAAFNFDTVAVAPAGSPVGFIGEGRTALDATILEVMEAGDRELGNREFAEQFVRRQDGWALLEQGVPAVFLSTAFGSEIVLGPYLSNDYHQASDDIDRIELGGAIDDLLLHEELVRRFADTELYATPGQ